LLQIENQLSKRIVNFSYVDVDVNFSVDVYLNVGVDVDVNLSVNVDLKVGVDVDVGANISQMSHMQNKSLYSSGWFMPGLSNYN
jgi:hypothetical protein